MLNIYRAKNFISYRSKLALFGLFSILISSYGYAERKIVIKGSDHNDVLMGGAEANEIYGGEGQDILRGGGGGDVLHGGDGADTFIVTPDDLHSFGTVIDFDSNEGDKVEFEISKGLNEREKHQIPKKLSLSNVSLDYRGNINILLLNNQPQTILNIKQSNLALKVEDRGKKVLITFEKKI